jgi:hypothetical protein
MLFPIFGSQHVCANFPAFSGACTPIIIQINLFLGLKPKANINRRLFQEIWYLRSCDFRDCGKLITVNHTVII